ncbi:hypothetical protein [Shewanella litorisediminis]|uniref:Uncharacterized protein n=1 Tax=Shewanella litorisediminis TaxID=1173586 RepID=A0ABX7G4E7_9GAMM|nr:hypothetical protein [Shewanella litorisediminis]MCL2920099.1 hypothetical protein [Shewanella litorisediminis]QRH02120.1 hypothetical protein JQC75_01425 [Shewanella litorisediminis]
MSVADTQFVRIYKRKSKSPWDDHNTMLLLADVVDSDEDSIELGFSRYIYLHRNILGQILGISTSKSIQAEHPEFEGQYLSGTDMYAILLCYLDEIVRFCDLYRDEFRQAFGLTPEAFFQAAEDLWIRELSED